MSSESEPTREGDDPKLPKFYTGGVVPNGKFVDALMRTVEFGIWPPSDKRKKSQKIPDTTLEGCLHRNPELFLPPRDILIPEVGENGEYEISLNEKSFWQTGADLLVLKAQRKTYSAVQLAALREESATTWKGISEIWRGYAVRNHRENLYMDINTKAYTSEELARVTSALSKEVKAKLKRALEVVLADRAALDEVQKAAEGVREITRQVVFAERIDYVECVRAQVERSDEQAEFVETITAALRKMGIDDLDVELLTGADHITHDCCEGLYTPAKSGQRAKISIPMTVYGTSLYIPWNRVLEIVAHEVAHHDIAKANVVVVDPDQAERAAIGENIRYRIQVVNGTYLCHSFPKSKEWTPRDFFLANAYHDHGFFHTIVEHRVAQALQTLQYGGEAKVEDMPQGVALVRDRHTRSRDNRPGRKDWKAILPWNWGR